MIYKADGTEYIQEVEELADSLLLKDSEITLVPSIPTSHEKDYLLNLACKDKYNSTPRNQLEKGLELIQYYWVGLANGARGGCLFLCYLEAIQWWTLDAYFDDVLDNRLGDYSFRAGRLVTDWYFGHVPNDSLYTIHRTANYAATKVCKRLGFEVYKQNPEFIFMKLERKTWESKH